MKSFIYKLKIPPMACILGTAVSCPDVAHEAKKLLPFSCGSLFREISAMLQSLFGLSVLPLICLHIQVTKDILGVFNSLLAGKFGPLVPLRVHSIKSQKLFGQ